MGQPLSQDVFEVWKESDDEFKREMREHIAMQLRVNQDTHGRVVALETYRKSDIVRLGLFSSIISAMAGAFAMLWRH